MPARNSLAAVFAPLALGCLTAAAAATPPTVTVSSQSQDTLIRQRLGVSAYTPQDIAPLVTPQGLEVQVVVAGTPYTLLLHPQQIVAPGGVMTLDYGNGNMVNMAPPEMGIYEGTVSGLAGSSVVAQWVEGRFSAMVLRNGAAAWHVQPLEDVRHGLPGHVAYLQDDVIPVASVCGNEPVVLSPSHIQSLVRHGVLRVTDGGLVAEIACEADFNFTSTLPSASAVAQDISRVMAWVSKFYTEAVGVRFRVVRYVLRMNDIGNYTDFDADVLLAAFRARWNFYFSQTDRDLAHLFTGRDMTGDVIGLGSLGVVCNVNAAYSESQTTYTAGLGMRASLTAHETGHNFGAGHCDQAAGLCAPCGIMLAAASSVPAQALHFGCSSTALQTFLNSPQSQCLDPGDAPAACRADVNGDGMLTLADFGAFQSAYALGNTYVADFDRDGALTLADFGAFKGAFAAGCP